jgi:hypothetical protein
MLDQLDDKTDDLELETPEPEVDGADPDGLEPDGNADQAEADGEGEVIVSFGDEEPEQPQEAAEWVTALRKQNRELKAKVKELEVVAQPKRDVQMPKPTLEACDYDADKFETELLAWNAQKAEAGRAEAEAKQAWENRLKTYSEQKQALRVRGYDDAEDAVREIMSVTQQGIILQAADEPARLVYALGLSPSKAKELAGEKDPVRFAAKVAKMEMQLKDTPRKPAAAPDRKPVGAGATPAALQPRLDKLKAEAHASGDWTKYFAEKRNSQG